MLIAVLSIRDRARVASAFLEFVFDRERMRARRCNDGADPAR